MLSQRKTHARGRRVDRIPAVDKGLRTRAVNPSPNFGHFGQNEPIFARTRTISRGAKQFTEQDRTTYRNAHCIHTREAAT